MKLVLWLILALVVVYVLRNKKRNREHSRQQSARQAPESEPRSGQPGQAEAMLRCAHCALYLPESEAVRTPQGTVFCSSEHRRLHEPQ